MTGDPDWLVAQTTRARRWALTARIRATADETAAFLRELAAGDVAMQEIHLLRADELLAAWRTLNAEVDAEMGGTAGDGG